MTHICVGNLTTIGSDNGLSPDRRQAIIWTNAGILSVGPLVINFSKISIEIHTFSLKEMHLKMSSGKWRPFCLGLKVLRKYTKIEQEKFEEISWHQFENYYIIVLSPGTIKCRFSFKRHWLKHSNDYIRMLFRFGTNTIDPILTFTGELPGVLSQKLVNWN